MSRFLLDTNVLLDIATADPTWLAWSEGQFRAAAALGPILMNPIIYPLPDFCIGAHSEAEGLTLVTRDAARYRTYFPSVTIISP